MPEDVAPTPVSEAIDLALKAYDYSVDLKEKADARLQAEIDAAFRDGQMKTIIDQVNEKADSTNGQLDDIAATEDIILAILRHVAYGNAVSNDPLKSEGEWNTIPNVSTVDAHAVTAIAKADSLLSHLAQAVEILREITSGISYYSPDTAGIAAFETDVANGMVWGGSDGMSLEGPIVMRVGPLGENVPTLNPKFFTFTMPASGESRRWSDLLADVINLIPIYPRGG